MATSTPAPTAERVRGVRRGPRFGVSRGLVTISAATLALFVASAVLASTSVSQGALGGMLPFAAVLAIAALGQTLGDPAGRHRPLGPRVHLARGRHRHARAEG